MDDQCALLNYTISPKKGGVFLISDKVIDCEEARKDSLLHCFKNDEISRLETYIAYLYDKLDKKETGFKE